MHTTLAKTHFYAMKLYKKIFKKLIDDSNVKIFHMFDYVYIKRTRNVWTISFDNIYFILEFYKNDTGFEKS